MRKPAVILIIAFWGIACGRSAALTKTAKPAAADKTLVAIFRALERLDGMSCQMRLERKLAGDTAIMPAEQMLCYSSRRELISYTQSAGMVTLICPKGQFRADIAARKVYYNDTLPAAIRERFAGSDTPFDSLLLSQAQIITRSKQQQELRYTLRFTEGSAVTEMKLRYNTRDSMISRFEYTMEQQIGAEALLQRKKGIRMQQHVVTSNYSRQAPRELRALLQQLDQLEPYLQKAYPGFTLEKK